jgi:hypothetical protein
VRVPELLNINRGNESSPQERWKTASVSYSPAQVELTTLCPVNTRKCFYLAAAYF